MEVFRAIFAEAFGQFVGQGEISVWATMPPPPRSKNFSDEIVFAPPKISMPVRLCKNGRDELKQVIYY